MRGRNRATRERCVALSVTVGRAERYVRTRCWQRKRQGKGVDATCAEAGVGREKSEARGPKAERSPKSDGGRSAGSPDLWEQSHGTLHAEVEFLAGGRPPSPAGRFRSSDFGLLSAFGSRPSEFAGLLHQPPSRRPSQALKHQPSVLRLDSRRSANRPWARNRIPTSERLVPRAAWRCGSGSAARECRSSG